MFTLGATLKDEAGTEYRIVQEFAPGGQGFAYRVERLSDGEPYVLKHLVFGADAGIARRTRKLVDADLRRTVSAALAAPEVIVPTTSGVAYVMPFAEGHDLETLLSAVAWSLPERIQLAAALCAVLARLRDGDALHGDLSPRNVHAACGPDGLWRIALIDLDNLVHGRLPGAPMLGTPEYLPVELLRKTITGQPCDLTAPGENFAIAVLTHEILRGAHPFVWSDGDPPTTIADRLARGHREWRRPVGAVAATALSHELSALFDRGLGPDPSGRPSPDEWKRGLVRALSDVYVCDTCAEACVNDPTRSACPSCRRPQPPPKLRSNLGHEFVLVGAALALGALELARPELEAQHVVFERAGFSTTVMALLNARTHLVSAHGLATLPAGERIELRAGDRLRLGRQLELRVE